MPATSTPEPDRASARLVFPLQIGDVWIAIDPSCVLELLGSRSWMRVPGMPAHVLGVMAWRSRAIAVLELRPLLGITAGTTGGGPRTVVARIGDCTFAFFVDVAREARTVESAALGVPHAVTGKYVKHQLVLDGRVLPLIDLEAMIESISRPEAS